MMSKPVSSEDYEQIKQFLRCGISDDTLCKRFNISLDTLQDIKAEINEPAKKFKGKRFTYQDYDKIKTLLNNGLTDAEIGSIMDSSAAYIGKLRRNWQRNNKQKIGG